MPACCSGVLARSCCLRSIFVWFLLLMLLLLVLWSLRLHVLVQSGAAKWVCMLMVVILLLAVMTIISMYTNLALLCLTAELCLYLISDPSSFVPFAHPLFTAAFPIPL